MAYPFAFTQLLSARAVAVLGILALHALIAYLLLTALMQSVLPREPPALQPTFISEPPHVPTAPRTAATVDLSASHPRIEDLKSPVLVVPQLQPQVQDTPPALRSEPDSGGAAPVAADPLRIIGRNQMPDTQEYYPPALIREGVEGAAFVRVCVDERGARQGEPVIEQTSGNAQLDLSALNVARHGRYARAVQAGVPVPNCFRFRIGFRLK